LSRTATRWTGFGTSIFTEMSALAERTGAINLGQGFPDEDGPAAVLEAAAAALRAGHNQYAPLPGVPALRAAIAAHQRRFYGLEVDPEAGVQVTFGATEAIAAALLGLCEPGDEVVCFEPYYDSYAAGIAMAGAVRRPVTLRPPGWPVDPDALAAMVADARSLSTVAAREEGCTASPEVLWRIAPTPFDRGLVEEARRACAEVGGADRALPSGALHDAAQVAAVAPAAMVFCSSIAGVSHAIEEDTSERDLELSLQAFGLLAERVIAGASSEGGAE